jgi:hypothetical protein
VTDLASGGERPSARARSTTFTSRIFSSSNTVTQNKFVTARSYSIKVRERSDFTVVDGTMLWR